MAPKTLDFKCAVITGGAGGLGKTKAKWLISRGKKVILVGRTESKLKEAAQELGHGTAYYVLDTGDIPAIAPFCKRIISEHPEVDCLINNAGVQRPLNCNNFPLEKADQEIAINISGPIHLIMGFLEHFKSKSSATIINVSSVLGFSPTSIINPVYNATKAFQHFWTMNLRSQLLTDRKSAHIKVVEIAPPSVTTDLHRERSDPSDNTKEKNKSALSVDEYMEDVAEGWESDADVIGPGMAKELVKKWYGAFGSGYEDVQKAAFENGLTF